MYEAYGEACISENIFTKTGFSLRKTVHEHSDSLVKEKRSGRSGQKNKVILIVL